MDIRDLSFSGGSELFGQYLTPIQNRPIRRSLNVKSPSKDFFEILRVPDIVITEIFRHLPLAGILSAMSVCRRFRRIGSSPFFWRNLELSDVTIEHEALHTIFERQPQMVKLSRARIYKENDFISSMSSDGPWNKLLEPPDPLVKLTFLDLSYAVYSDLTVLNSILERTVNLQVLNIAQFPAIDDEICNSIARNTNLEYLNLEMCQRFSTDGFLAILSSCERLLELNVGWARFEPNTLETACRVLPTELRRLNLSGMENLQLTDHMVEIIVNRCTLLIEIDCSDCGDITGDSIEHFNRLNDLRKLSLCRCHSVEPISLGNIKPLVEFNIYGSITNEGIEFLRSYLQPTLVNTSPLSDIARPSIHAFQRRVI